jgi:pyruvate formate lyase activating enzyme
MSTWATSATLERSSTDCSHFNTRLIGRRGYTIPDWNLNPDGACASCGTRLPGVIESAPGHWGSRRLPVRLASYAA